MDFVILVDSREQAPLVFPGVTTARATLGTADYSIRTADHDYRDQIAVERKSLGDLYGCFGQSRDRFERELERLAGYCYPAIVIEATLADVVDGARFSQVHPHSAIGSLIAWSVRHRIPVWPAGDRRTAAATVCKILFHAARYIRPAAGRR